MTHNLYLNGKLEYTQNRSSFYLSNRTKSGAKRPLHRSCFFVRGPIKPAVQQFVGDVWNSISDVKRVVFRD